MPGNPDWDSPKPGVNVPPWWRDDEPPAPVERLPTPDWVPDVPPPTDQPPRPHA